jgi:hypothetical protein
MVPEMLLSAAMKREFSASKIAWAVIVAMQVGALAVAGGSFFYERRWSAVALFVGAAVPIAAAVLKQYAGVRYDLGERLRRLLVRAEGLGTPVSSTEHLLATLGKTSLPSWDPDPIGSYYSSPKPVGPARLAHIVAQSAFFTAKLTGTATILCWLPVLVGVLCGVVLLLAVVMLESASAGLGTKVAQAASCLIAFGFASEFYQLKTGYAELGAAARRTLEDCCALAKEDQPRADSVWLAVGCYDQALAKAPPIPGIVYRLQRGDLDKEWAATEAALPTSA